MADFKQLIKLMENYLGPNAGFVVLDTIKRLGATPETIFGHKVKTLADILCDEVLGNKLSIARSKMLKSKLYSILEVSGNSYVNKLQYWQ